MLTTPASEVVRDRLAWNTPQPLSTATARLAQMRAGTLAMYPHDELATGTPSAEICVDCDGFGFTAKQHRANLKAVARLRPQAAAAIDQCLAALIEVQGESFDLVVTDPPYADGGMRTFVATAIRLTTFGGEIHIAVPALLTEASTGELLLQVQSDLICCGFAIERVVPGAFTYLTSDVVSSLVIARRIAGSRLVGATNLLAPCSLIPGRLCVGSPGSRVALVPSPLPGDHG